jgi:peptidyl-Lys metalloendopeptidase
MLKNIEPYRIRVFFLMILALSSILSGCVLDDQVPLVSGSYVPVPGRAAGPIALIEVDHSGQEVVFYLQDGSGVAVSITTRERADWPSGCPTNLNSTTMEVLDIAGGPLTLGDLTFEDPILVRDCPVEPERIALREDGPVGGGGGACLGVDTCLHFNRQLEAAPVLTARAVAANLPPPTEDSQAGEGSGAGGDLAAELQIAESLPNGDTVPLIFSLTNQSDRPLYFLKWFTPLEGIGGEIFRVRRDGQLVPYQGLLASRSDPTPDAYVFLEAGETVSAEVDLTEAYDFSQDGTYTIAFLSPRISHVARSEAQMARTMDALGPVEIPADSVTVTIPGPVGDSSKRDVDQAQETLSRYFTLLYQGRYAEAVDLYGGPYDVLQAWNPTADADDHAGLLEKGCTVNGLYCLPVRGIQSLGSSSADGFTFRVEFENPDGTLFVADPEGTSPQSAFDYTVVRKEQGYAVRELPVYVP